MKTRFTELVGIEKPIMCGGMYHVGVAELCAAISNAGGLGTITSSTQGTPENLRNEIKKIRSLTDKPFAVNLNLFQSSKPLPNDEFIEVMREEGVKIVETSGKNPETIIPQLKKAGFIVIHKVPGVKFAKKAEKLGVDAVSVVGFETGGHPGMEDIGSLVLTRMVSSSVSIPVLGGGGFADGKGLIAALGLGAEGIVMGTRFLAIKESLIHDNIKNWMIQADEYSTTIVQKSIKSPNRVALNEVSREVLEKELNNTTIEELLPLITGSRAKNVFFGGDINGGLMSCGQSVGLINDIPTAQCLLDRIMQEASEATKYINERVN